MHKKYLIVTAILSMALIAGCSKTSETEAIGHGVDETAPTAQEEGGKTESEAVVIDFETPENETAENTEIEDVKSTAPLESEFKSPLTGLPVAESVLATRPTVVMLDNQYNARPQAGLSQADHIYEILAEGRITRYMAVFQSEAPSPVGPVRSARPYFISKALEYDPNYVHVGGSMQALTDIINLNMADIDGLSSGGSVFWRTRHKRIPHNMYSSLEAIQKESVRKNYRQEVEVNARMFNEETTKPGGDPCTYVKAVYKQPTSRDSVGYYIYYEYNEENKNYNRFVNGEAHVDENNSEQLTADNIIIQIAKHKVIDDEGRRQIALIGEGTGYYITCGEKIPVTWKKADRYSQTKYYTQDGTEIKFNPGNTWFQIVESDSTLGW